MPQVVLMTEEAVWTDAETFPLRQMMRAKQIPQIAGKFDFQQIIFLFQKPAGTATRYGRHSIMPSSLPFRRIPAALAKSSLQLKTE